MGGPVVCRLPRPPSRRNQPMPPPPPPTTEPCTTPAPPQARTLQAAPGADGDLQEGAPTDREEPPSAAPTPAPAPAVELEELTVDSGAALLNQINLTGMVLVDPRPANEYDGVCDGADCQNMADGRPYCCRDSRRTWFFKSPVSETEGSGQGEERQGALTARMRMAPA